MGKLNFKDLDDAFTCLIFCDDVACFVIKLQILKYM